MSSILTRVCPKHKMGASLISSIMLQLTGQHLSIEEVVRVSRLRDRVAISSEARERVINARKFVEKLVEEGRVVYGLTTGFGEFKSVSISKDQTEQLQTNLIRSHATGVGAPYSEEVVRAAILIRVNSLLHGHSGVRPEVIDHLVAFLNQDVYPFVPCQGSVGASGDLAPLSHVMLVLFGEGEVMVNGQRMPSLPVLRQKGIEPIRLSSKEGLALNNGTAFLTGVGALAVHDAQQLAKVFDIAYGISLESLMGTISACDERVHALRPHPGQIACAANMRRLCAQSKIMESHKDCGRVQDAYSLRCAPQVHGACRDAIAYVAEVLERELNSVTDNPLLFPDDGVAISAGHFHGEPVALAMDHLKIAVAELANISERRTARLVDPHLSDGLPAFLIPKEEGGLSSGYMIPQYVAAALVSENKVLAHPASVDSIPTSAGQEDHVSMGSISSRQAAMVVENTKHVAAIELMCAAQAADFRKPFTLGLGTNAAHALIRSVVPMLAKDRILYTDIEKIETLIPGALVQAVEQAVGRLA